MRICLLASGSRGNAIYIEAGDTRLLIDAGLSLREIRLRLQQIDVDPDSLHALLLTHEHIDHSRSVGPWARRSGRPVYVHTDLCPVLAPQGVIAELREFTTGASFALRDLNITPFPLTHDATACVGFTVECAAGKAGIATDLGIATRLVGQTLQGCRALVLEFNHDEELLRDGPYPWHLKQRIRSQHGHLSNPAAGQLLDGLLWDGLEAVFLAHLSETNNTPEHALAAAQLVLDRQNCCRPKVILGTQNRISQVYAAGA